jgi:putative membrane protein
VVLLGSLNGPLHDLSDYYLFSMHMVQHLVLTLVFPPLLLAGIPEWLLRPLLEKPGVLRRVIRFLTLPWVAAFLFSVSIAVWHLRPFYDLMMRSHEVHISTHLMFMATATLMWWPVMSPLPERRLPTGLSMLYLFLVGIPMQVVAALITFADEVLYPWYVVAPRMWGLSPLDDQQLGGLIMWVPGNLYIFAAIGVLFFRWAKEEG